MTEFKESDFVDSCKELDDPQVIDWELFTKTDDVKIFRLYNQTSGLYSYKIVGVIRDVKPELCARVYTDLEYRKTWDGYVEELYEIAEGSKKGIYWQIRCPFPLANRDYTFVRSERELDVDGRHVWVILSRAHVFDSVLPRSGVVRVAEFEQSMAITDDGNNGTKAFMYYYDNPGGMIPTWLINWAAKNGVPRFLDDMDKACRGYAKYLADKSVVEPVAI